MPVRTVRKDGVCPHHTYGDTAGSDEAQFGVSLYKGWLFCDSPKGADSSAIVYTLVETAKANGLAPYRYLERSLTELPSSEKS